MLKTWTLFFLPGEPERVVLAEVSHGVASGPLREQVFSTQMLLLSTCKALTLCLAHSTCPVNGTFAAFTLAALLPWHTVGVQQINAFTVIL